MKDIYNKMQDLQYSYKGYNLTTFYRNETEKKKIIRDFRKNVRRWDSFKKECNSEIEKKIKKIGE